VSGKKAALYRAYVDYNNNNNHVFFYPPASLNFRNGEIITNLKLSSKTSTVLAQFTRVIEISFKDEDTAANML